MIPATRDAHHARDDRPRFLSQDDANDIARRIARYANGGGYSGVWFRSKWSGTVRWARNRISNAGDDENNHVLVMRNIRGARSPRVELNETTDAALVAALRKTERLLQLDSEVPDADFVAHVQLEPEPAPNLFFDATYQVNAEQLTGTARNLIQSAADAGMLSAGYIEVTAHSEALLTSWGITMYNRYTWARHSVTVRDPKGTGSGWAGVDWPDWTRIDGKTLSAIALQKCLTSRNPARVEPGRYTTILEPQAVCDLVDQLIREQWGQNNYIAGTAIFNKESLRESQYGVSKLGDSVVDERITISADPMDPELGFPPFGYWLYNGDPWSLLQTHIAHPTTWIKNGVLTNLARNRIEGILTFGENLGHPNLGAFRISVNGPTTSIEDMIATTTRGLLVTRFDQVIVLEKKSVLCRGYTRDGLWLIENGKISKPVVNMAFTESPLFALNNVEQVGAPQRAFHPQEPGWWDNPRPVIVPPLKVRDFSFTALADAV